MIALALATTLVLQDTPQKSEADVLFSKMIAKFSTAKTVVGTVDFMQTATVDGVLRRVEIRSNIQTEAPNKFFLQQVDASKGTSFTAVCDGKQICYSAPQEWVERGKPKIFEPASKERDANVQAFAILMPDRSFPIGLALYSTNEIKQTVYRLRNLKIEGEVAVGGVNAQKVRATYIIDDGGGRLPASLTVAYYYITKEGDLVYITREETVGGGQTRDAKGNILKQESYKVASQWAVNFKFDAPVDAAAFRITR